MWTYSVLQNQRLVLAIFGGTVVLLSIVLVYMALWKPREGEIHEDAVVASRQNAPLREWLASMPWLLAVTAAAIVVYGVGYVLYLAHRPPNW
ncbi:MAG: hypothetical protein FWE88_00740 [Phycisphaerae bacterium]|nr:hypothetical protein [Phycisphaerae bacterium]